MRGTRLSFPYCLSRVPIFRYLTKSGVGALVRTSCAQLLVNLSSHLVHLPEGERPWASLSITDEIARVNFSPNISNIVYSFFSLAILGLKKGGIYRASQEKGLVCRLEGKLSFRSNFKDEELKIPRDIFTARRSR